MNGTAQLVVVVEDDVGLSKAMRRLLVAAGYRTRAFESAEAFAAANGANGADCLVLDVHLPGASGTELYAQLGNGRPPAVFTSARDGPQVREAVARSGAGPLLPKPFLANDLLASIARATQKRTPHRPEPEATGH